ncbi:molybdopterin molybdotransferase MoeA [Algoriphagus namhaensis]
MISVAEAKNILQRLELTRVSVTVPIQEAQGLFLARDIAAPMAVPSFDNSAMDGYAFFWQEGLRELRVVGEVSAGSTAIQTLETGEAVRIFTGAPIPTGADTVIVQEKVLREGVMIRFDPSDAEKGRNIRYRGTQCQAADQIAGAGSKVTPGMVSLLASVGVSSLEVWRAPRVSVMVTGNELLEVGSALRRGEIYNSNGPALSFWLKSLDVQVVREVRSSDVKSQVIETLREALEESDLVLITGGISVGDYDFVREAIEENGVEELFYKLRQRPGKPLFAGRKSGKIVFGLPGNPGPVLSCFMHYVKPLIQSWKGDTEAWEAFELLPLSEGFQKKKPLTHFLNAVKSGGKVLILQGQESFNLSALTTASGYVEIPEESGDLKAGDLVKFYPW